MSETDDFEKTQKSKQYLKITMSQRVNKPTVTQGGDGLTFIYISYPGTWVDVGGDKTVLPSG